MYNNKDLVPLKSTQGNFGIDKLKLHTEHFEVSNINPWNIVPNRKVAGKDIVDQTPLFNSNGELVNGEKAYINTPTYNLTINNGRVWVELNPSKIHHQTNLVSDTNIIAEQLKNIQKECKEVHKLDLDIFSTGIGRLDITAQAQMNNLVPDYKDIIANGNKSKKLKQSEYPNGFLLGNKQRQVCSYDKGMKLLIDAQIKNPQSTNFQRLETRLLNSSAIKSHSEFKYLTHLLNGNVEQLHSAYSKSIGQILSIGQPEISFVEMNTLTDLIRTSIQSAGKRGQWLNFLLMVLGSNLPNPNQFKEAFNRLYAEGIVSKNQYHKMIKLYTELKHKSDFAKGRYLQETANSYEQRFKEFTEKLILPYKTA
jgi:hypothetical protein